jgi:archaellum component FlaC
MNAPKVVKEWLTVDNLVKVVFAGLFMIGSYLWNDINDRIGSLENSMSNVAGQSTIVELRDTIAALDGKVERHETESTQNALVVERSIRDDLQRGLDRMNNHSHPEDPRLTGINRELGTIVAQLQNIDEDLEGISVDVRRLDLEDVPEVEEQVSDVRQNVQTLTEAVQDVSSRVNARGVITNTGVVPTPTSDGSFPAAPSIPGVQ